MGIDATTKWKEEGYLREWPEVATMDESIKKKVLPVWEEVLQKMLK
jgi:4-hydroxy-3-polyprenylbenzoate decarboxylase